MPNPVVSTYTLSADEMGRDGLLPYLNADGAFIGEGASLLEKDGAGLWKARSRPALEALLSVGYSTTVDLKRCTGEFMARSVYAVMVWCGVETGMSRDHNSDPVFRMKCLMSKIVISRAYTFSEGLKKRAIKCNAFLCSVLFVPTLRLLQFWFLRQLHTQIL